MPASAFLPERLPFTLPDFTRVAWVSDRAHAVWRPRFSRILAAWDDLEWRSVAAGVRRCTMRWLSDASLARQSTEWRRCGLRYVVLASGGDHGCTYSSTPRPLTPGQAALRRVVVASQADAETFATAFASHDHDALGAMLGYPSCCREFFQQVWIDARMVDTTWAMAVRSRESAAPRDTIAVDGRWEANVLWRWTGLRPVPHLPCSAACEATAALASDLRRLAIERGSAEEMDWLQEVLQWPVEWSGLHGIAQIKTPVLRISTRTDATANLYRVRWRGARYPAEGASGLDFPYRIPARLMVSGSTSFERGLEHPVRIEHRRPEWHYRDNGFASDDAMQRCHAPVVAFARSLLSGRSGPVLDLGCGNGLLLRSICRGRDALVPYGVDLNETAVHHARQLQPTVAGNFVIGDLFDDAVWTSSLRYALVVLMVGRLLEAPPHRAARLMDVIRRDADQLLVYRYPGGTSDTFERSLQRAGLRAAVTAPAGDIASVILRPDPGPVRAVPPFSSS